MDEYSFKDVLTGSDVTCSYPYLQSVVIENTEGAFPCESIFFPGCSFINYALPLVQAVYDTLLSSGSVQGISLLCCGKILSYEEDGQAKRDAFEVQLYEHLKKAGVKRIIAACPNCVTALRNACAKDEEAAKIDIVALPAELARLGYRIDIPTAQALAAPETNCDNTIFCPHDSCPDRQTGEFAQGVRDLLGEGAYVERAHSRKKSTCCGSLTRAAGNFDGAEKAANFCGKESLEAGAQAIVTACMSCSFLLTALQNSLPVYHYLELLYNWRIDWVHSDAYMKLRFLFDESLGAVVKKAGKRNFVALDVEGEIDNHQKQGKNKRLLRFGCSECF